MFRDTEIKVELNLHCFPVTPLVLLKPFFSCFFCVLQSKMVKLIEAWGGGGSILKLIPWGKPILLSTEAYLDFLYELIRQT